MRERKQVSSGAPWEAIAGYCRAVQVGNTVHVAGTTAPGDTAAEQLENAFVIIADALAELGLGLQHVVRTRMYVTDISGWRPIAEAHGRVFAPFAPHRPVTAMVEISALVEPWMTVEIEAVAIVPPDEADG